METHMNVKFLYQEDSFDMKTDNGSTMTLFKTLFLTEDKKLITYYLKEKVAIDFELPEVQLDINFKPNAKGKLEMAITGVKY